MTCRYDDPRGASVARVTIDSSRMRSQRTRLSRCALAVMLALGAAIATVRVSRVVLLHP